MKSVGEAMAIGRNFTEAMQKALRSVEQKGSSFHWRGEAPTRDEALHLLAVAARPTDGRLVTVQQALRGGASVEEAHEATGIDPWFSTRSSSSTRSPRPSQTRPSPPRHCSAWHKRHGFSRPAAQRDPGMPEAVVRGVRHALGVRPVFRPSTPAPPSSRRRRRTTTAPTRESEVAPRERAAVIILGSGRTDRPGRRVDYSCVHASFALRDAATTRSWSTATRDGLDRYDTSSPSTSSR